MEAAAAPALVSGQSVQRQPFDGRDDDDNSLDFRLAPNGTPRAPNAP